MYFVVGKPLNDLFACINCSLLKTFDEFFMEGCDNCENFLHLKGNPPKILVCTTRQFEGIIGLPNSNLIWTTRVCAVERICFGAYALYVFDYLPPYITEELLQYPYY